MAATQATNPASVSPKVKASAWTTLGLTLLATALAGITPAMLEALGVWAGPVFALLASLGAAIAGYLKSDPARDSLTRAVDVSAPTPTGMPPSGYVAPQAAAEVAQVYPAEPEDDGKPGRHEAV